MRPRIRSLVLPLAITVIATFGDVGSAFASTVIAKFPPTTFGYYGGFTPNAVFTTGGRTFVARMATDRRMTIQRVGRRTRVATIANVDLRQAGDGAVAWAGSATVVAARTERVVISEQEGPNDEYLHGLLASGIDRPLVTLDRCPLGPFAVHGSRVAEISRPCGKSKPLVIKVFELRGKSFKRVASTPLPGDLSAPSVPGRRVDWQIGINDRLAVLTRAGTAVAFNWRSGALARNIALTGDDVVDAEINDNGDVIVVTRNDSGAWFAQNYPQEPGAGSWTTASGYGPFQRRIADNLLFRSYRSASPDYAISSLDINSGKNSDFGLLPTWAETSNNVLSMASVAVGADRVAWGTQTCYWETVSAKPLTSSLSIPADVCPVKFLKGSARLRGRRVLVTVTSPRGFSHATTVMEQNGFSAKLGANHKPPGRQMLSFPITARQAKYLRSNRGTTLTFRISRERVDDVSYAGSLRRKQK